MDPDGLQRRGMTPQQLVHLIRALAEESWDYFFLLLEQISGVEMPEELKDELRTLLKPKRLAVNARKGTGALFQRTVEHLRKLENEPNSQSAGHWMKEIKTFVGNILKNQKQ